MKGLSIGNIIFKDDAKIIALKRNLVVVELSNGKTHTFRQSDIPFVPITTELLLSIGFYLNGILTFDISEEIYLHIEELAFGYWTLSIESEPHKKEILIGEVKYIHEVQNAINTFKTIVQTTENHRKEIELFTQ